METTNNPAIDDSTPQLHIERNGATLAFYATEMTRGPKKGSNYPCPRLKGENFDNVKEFFGTEYILERLQASVRQQCQGYFETAVSGGEFDLAIFKTCVKSLAVVRKSKAELIEELQDALIELRKYDRADLSESDRAIELPKIIAKVSQLSAEIDARRRKGSDDE